MRISDWSSDVCSSDLCCAALLLRRIAKRNEASINHGGPAPPHAAPQDRKAHPLLRIPDPQSPTLLDSRRLVDRKSLVAGKSVSVSVAHGGRRITKQKNHKNR